MDISALAGATIKEKKSSKAVIKGVLQSVSPSQIKTFSSCPRSWWFDKVAGLRPPEEEEPEHFAVGTALHKQQEDYYELDKTPDNESCRYVLGLPGVPSRSVSGILIEEPRNYELRLYAAGIPMRGRIDLRAPPQDGTFTILDWKSCKNFKYCKSPEDLARDVQGIVYLKYGFTQYPEAEYGIFKHVYIKTEGVGGKVVPTEALDRNTVDDVYREIEKTVERIKQTAGLEVQDDVEFDKSACFAYGGCPYQKHCNAFKRKKVETQEMDKSFIERMKAAKNNPEPVKPQEVKAPTQDRANVAVQNQTNTPILPQEMRNNGPDVNTSIVPPDAPKPEKQEPGLEVKKILEDLRTGKLNEELFKEDPLYVDDHPELSKTALLVLYIDCFPVKKNVNLHLVHLENLIKDAEFNVYKSLEDSGKLSKSTPCFDLRQVPYGQGVAELVAHFKANPPTGLVLASSNGLSGVVAEALIPLATEVYKGVR